VYFSEAALPALHCLPLDFNLGVKPPLFWICYHSQQNGILPNKDRRIISLRKSCSWGMCCGGTGYLCQTWAVTWRERWKQDGLVA
jgi:hypothetical protein